jgi:hypothetical protein
VNCCATEKERRVEKWVKMERYGKRYRINSGRERK